MFRYIILIVVLNVGFFAQAQKSQKRVLLEKQKAENLKKIAKVSKILNQTKSEKQNTIGEVKAIEEQIRNQISAKKIEEADFELLTQEGEQLKSQEKALVDKKIKLQKDFAEVIYRSEKKSTQLTKLGFLFSSGSLNELFVRYKYLNQFAQNQKNKIVEIAQVNEQISLRQKLIVRKKIDGQKALAEIARKNKVLETLKSQQQIIVKNLSVKEAELRQQITERKVQLKKIDDLISKIISKNINQTSLDNRPTNGLIVSSKGENINQTNGFASLKANMPWPVEGFISGGFGISRHAIYSEVKIENIGIDIQTEENANVTSVYAGKVVDISQISGLNYAVALRHGSYYTVYLNLINVAVAVNDEISANQKIGEAGKKEGTSEINFQIWHNFDKLNPEAWLRAK